MPRHHIDSPDLWGLAITGSLAFHLSLPLLLLWGSPLVARSSALAPLPVEFLPLDSSPTVSQSSATASTVPQASRPESAGLPSRPPAEDSARAHASAPFRQPVQVSPQKTVLDSPPVAAVRPRVQKQALLTQTEPAPAAAPLPVRDSEPLRPDPLGPAQAQPEAQQPPALGPEPVQPLPAQAGAGPAQPQAELGAPSVSENPASVPNVALEPLGSDGWDLLDEPPQVLPDQPLPSYPAAALSSGWGGRTALWLELDTTGAVVQVRVNQSSGHPELDEAARVTVATWRFSPAPNGPQRRAVTLVIRFDPNRPS